MQISEIFYSIQGEGPKQGLPTVFVRTQGCSVGCHACDTSYSWHSRAGFTMDISDVMSRVVRAGGDCRRLCITGGEPLDQMSETAALVRMASRVYGYEVEVETSGCIEITDIEMGLWPCSFIVDVKTPSSGVSDKNVSQNLTRLRNGPGDAVVVVVDNEEDFEYGAVYIRKYLSDVSVPVFWHPNWYAENVTSLMCQMVRWLQKEGQPTWRLGYQLHKLIWGGETRGV